MPSDGDRILLLRQPWLDLLLSGQKTVEVRGARLADGGTWLVDWGRGACHAWASLENSRRVTLEEFRAEVARRRVDGAVLPYARTWLTDVLHVRRFLHLSFTCASPGQRRGLAFWPRPLPCRRVRGGDPGDSHCESSGKNEFASFQVSFQTNNRTYGF